MKDDEQIKWQKAVIRDEWIEKQEQWEKVISEEGDKWKHTSR